jgi:hypothetical protein
MVTMFHRAGPELDLTWLIMGKPGVLAAFLLCCTLLGAGTWLAAGRLGWRRTPATLAAVGLSLALAVTLVRSGGHLPEAGTNPVALCLRDAFSLDSGLQVLNFLMLMPFAFFATVATRRPVSVIVLSAVISGGIEILQGWTGLGVCQKQDFLNNTLGALVAASIGWLLVKIVRSARKGNHISDRRPLERV